MGTKTATANTSTIEKHMDAADAHDWLWTYQEEPHKTRRQQIIKAHPEVTKLCGPEPLTKWVVLLVVSIQMAAAYLLKDTSFFSWTFFLTAYIVGATANQNLFLAIHEISHNLAFRKPAYNRMLAMFANLPIGIPYSASFRPYHLIHHKAMGVEGLDTDLPTKIEALLLNSIAGKTFFCTFQICFYALRPMAVLQLPFTMTHFWNVVVQVVFDIILVKYITGWQGLIYFVFSDFLAGSLHPLAGHFISEHYVFDDAVKPSPRSAPNDGPAPPETFSYYGPLNFFTYNVGLHNEHHDFPAVPWTRLHKLRELASEFYDPLPVCDSWPLTIVRFIFQSEQGLWGRVKREDKKKGAVDIEKED